MQPCLLKWRKNLPHTKWAWWSIQKRHCLSVLFCNEPFLYFLCSGSFIHHFPSLLSHPSHYQSPPFFFRFARYVLSTSHFFLSWAVSFLSSLSIPLSVFALSLPFSLSMLSIGNYIIMRYPMKYSFSDTKYVCVCVWRWWWRGCLRF